MIKLIKTIMAKLVTKRFVPTQEEVQQGEQPMSKIEILDSLIRYSKQNPTKWIGKKEEKLKFYGLREEDLPEELKDPEEEELEAIKKRVTKAK